MNIRLLYSPCRVFVLWVFFLGATTPLLAAVCRVLVLSPSSTTTGFPAADISTQLKALLEGSGLYTSVDVTYRDITKDSNYATSLLGVAYVPPYRTDHIAAIQQGGWTHVVMIDRPFCYAVAPELHYEGVNAVAKIISAAGAQPVLMMPWIDRATMDGHAGLQRRGDEHGKCDRGPTEEDFCGRWEVRRGYERNFCCQSDRGENGGEAGLRTGQLPVSCFDV